MGPPLLGQATSKETPPRLDSSFDALSVRRFFSGAEFIMKLTQRQPLSGPFIVSFPTRSRSPRLDLYDATLLVIAEFGLRIHSRWDTPPPALNETSAKPPFRQESGGQSGNARAKAIIWFGTRCSSERHA